MSPSRLARIGSPFDQRLVRAARAENPPDGAEERALAALGLAAGANHADALVRRGSGALPGSATTLLALGVGIAVVVGAVGANLSLGVPRSRPSPGSSDVHPTVERTASRVEDSGSPIAPQEPSASPSVRCVEAASSGDHRAGRAVVPAQVTAPPPRASTSAPSKAGDCTLSVEIALVQQATRALSIGEAAVALSVLETHGRQCPSGVLGKEAGFLRVQALAANGDAKEATVLARRLLGADPHGVLAPRLRAAIDGGL